MEGYYVPAAEEVRTEFIERKSRFITTLARVSSAAEADAFIKKIKAEFIQSGLAAQCPIMAHIACIQMTTNTDVIVPFVARANAMSKSLGEEFITQSTWEEADRTYIWPDGMTSLEFWKTK